MESYAGGNDVLSKTFINILGSVSYMIYANQPSTLFHSSLT
jgi:hypothetical protein